MGSNPTLAFINYERSDFMIEKIQRYLAKYMSKKMAYRVVFTTYIILVMIPIIILGYLFDCMWFMIIGTLIVNKIRKYTFGYHTTNIKCTIFTLTILTIMGYVSRTVPLEWSFLFALFSARYIYLNAPLRLTCKGKTLKWHRDKISLNIILCLISAIIFMYLGENLIANCILWSLSTVALTLFENIDIERV